MQGNEAFFRMREAQFVRSNWLQTVISLAAFTSVFSSAEEMSASSRSITACARLCGGGVCVQHSSVGAPQRCELTVFIIVLLLL